MSQLPVPQLGSGGDPFAARSNQAVALGGRQEIRSLQSPGLTARPAASGSASVFRQLADTFGIVHAGAHSVAGHFAHLNSLDRGLASQRAKEILPDWLAKMERGDLETPLDLDMVPGAADSLVAEMMPEGVTKAFADEFRGRLTPQFIGAMHSRAITKHQENFEALKAVAIEGLAHETDPTKIQEAVNDLIEASYLPVDPEQTARDFGLHAARVAAITGNPDAFKAAESFLAGREPLAMAQYARQLDVTLRQEEARQENENRTALTAAVAAIYNEAESEGMPIPVDKALAIIEQADPLLQRSMRDELARRTASHNNALARQRAEARFAMQQSEIFDAVANFMEMPDKPFAARLLLQNLSETMGGDRKSFELTDPETGMKLSISHDEIMEAVKVSHFARLDQSMEPEQAFAEKMRFLVENDMTHDAWEASLAGGASTALSDWARILESGEAAGIPPMVRNAYQLYRQMGQTNQRLRDEHISSQSQRDFFDIAETAQRFGGQTEDQALMTAVKAMSPQGHFSSSFDRIESRKEVEREARAASSQGYAILFNRESAENVGEVMEALSMRANFYMETAKLPPKLALKRSKEWVSSNFQLINGWAVPLKSQLPSEFKDIAGDIFAQYARQFGEQEALTADDLTLVPGSEPDTLIIFDKRSLSIADNALSHGVFTVDRLHQIAFDRRTQEQERLQSERQVAVEANIARETRMQSGEVTPVEMASATASKAVDLSIGLAKRLDRSLAEIRDESFIARRMQYLADHFQASHSRDRKLSAKTRRAGAQGAAESISEIPGAIYRWMTTPRYVAAFDQSRDSSDATDASRAGGGQ